MAGLGERIHIGLKASAQQLHQKFLLVYPKLENAGGYELLRCLPNSRSLTRLQPPSGGHTPESLKGDVGQARVYIWPLQRDLDTTPIQNTASEAASQPSTQNFQVLAIVACCMHVIILICVYYTGVWGGGRERERECVCVCVCVSVLASVRGGCMI